MMSLGNNSQSGGSSVGKYLIVGGITFVAGIAATLTLSTWLQSGQRDAIQALAEQVQQMQVDVTRAAPEVELALPAATIEAAPAAVVEAAPVAEVISPVAGSIPSATAALAADPAVVEEVIAVAAAAPVIEAEAPEPIEVTAEVVAAAEETISREDRVAEALAAVHRNKMRMLTEGVLAGLYEVTTEEIEGGGTRIAIDARNARTATAEIQQLLDQAALDGDIALPASVSTSDGAVDTSTLLFDLVQRSLEAEGEEGQAAASELRQQAFAVSQATTEVEGGQRIYTVERGDSLAYIALQFYGSTGAYDRIYQANLDILDSPDRIRAGQRLVIPGA